MVAKWLAGRQGGRGGVQKRLTAGTERAGTPGGEGATEPPLTASVPWTCLPPHPNPSTTEGQPLMHRPLPRIVPASEPELPPAPTRSVMIRRSWVLLSQTRDAAVSC